MPITDGLTFVKIFRASPQHLDIPIIMITVEAEMNRAEVDKYINGFLKKPYTFTDLDNLIYSVVGRKVLAAGEKRHDVAIQSEGIALSLQVA